MVMELFGITPSPSIHQNVNGYTILLNERRFGRNRCIEFSIDKGKSHLWQCAAIQMLSVSLGLLSVCLCLNFIVGAVIFSVLFLLSIFDLMWSVEKEVLLVTVPLGIQFTAIFRTGQQTTCFIPWHCVKNVYIVEAISLHRVLYNLVVLTEKKELNQTASNLRLIPLFQGTKPRLHCLENIYQSLSSLLPQLTLNPPTMGNL